MQLCSNRAGIRSGLLAYFLAGAFLAFGPWHPDAMAAPEPSEEAKDVETLFGELDRFFEANPALKDTPGSGWKPYNRAKWFHQRRMDQGELPPRGARWQAWEQKRALESGPGHRAWNTWFSLGPANFGGRMLAIDFKKSNRAIVYAGAAGGGVWKSTDAGASWAAITDDLPSLGVGGLAVSRTSHDVVVIGTGEATFNIDRVNGVGILRSTDAGATWLTTNITYAAGNGHGFHFVTAGSTGTFLAGAVDGLYRSVDDGATWTRVMPTAGTSYVNGWYDAQWDPDDASRVYAVKGNDNSNNGVYLSTDDGASWALVGTGQPSSGDFGKSKLGVSNSTVYCYIGDPGFGGGVFGLIRSTDDGANWTQAAGNGLPNGQSWYNLSCTADPNNDLRVLCGAVTMARSNNSGDNFTTVGSNVHVDHHALVYEPGSRIRVWAVTDGGVFFSPSDGALFSWQDKNNGVVSYQFYDICVNNGPDPYYVMGGTQDNGTDKWSGTTTWNEGLFADGMVCNIDPTNGTTVYAEIQNGGHYKNTSSGDGNWVGINNQISGSARWVTPVDQDQNDGDRLFTETNAGIWRTTDGGNNWSNVVSNRAVWISVSPVDGNVVWTINGGTVRRSANGGDSFPTVSGFPFTVGNSTKILAHPTDVDAAFATFSSYSNVATVVHTSNQGSSWTDVTGDLPQIPVNAIAVDPSNPSHWFVGTDLGVWWTTNGGVSWTPYGDGFPNVVVDDLEIKDSLHKLVAGTHGRGAWEVNLPSYGVVDARVSAPAQARDLMLDEPWPNPARDRTLLRYAAKSDAPVSLKIYDVGGRLVSDLEDFARGDGIIRTTPWFTDDVPSGIYLAVLEAGSQRTTKKITVLK